MGHLYDTDNLLGHSEEVYLPQSLNNLLVDSIQTISRMCVRAYVHVCVRVCVCAWPYSGLRLLCFAGAGHAPSTPHY